MYFLAGPPSLRFFQSANKCAVAEDWGNVARLNFDSNLGRYHPDTIFSMLFTSMAMARQVRQAMARQAGRPWHGR